MVECNFGSCSQLFIMAPNYQHSFSHYNKYKTARRTSLFKINYIVLYIKVYHRGINLNIALHNTLASLFIHYVSSYNTLSWDSRFHFSHNNATALTPQWSDWENRWLHVSSNQNIDKVIHDTTVVYQILLGYFKGFTCQNINNTAIIQIQGFYCILL